MRHLRSTIRPCSLLSVLLAVACQRSGPPEGVTRHVHSVSTVTVSVTVLDVFGAPVQHLYVYPFQGATRGTPALTDTTGVAEVQVAPGAYRFGSNDGYT